MKKLREGSYSVWRSVNGDAKTWAKKEEKIYLFEVQLRRSSPPFKISFPSSSIFTFLYFLLCMLLLIGLNLRVWMLYNYCFDCCFVNFFRMCSLLWFGFNSKKHFLIVLLYLVFRLTEKKFLIVLFWIFFSKKNRPLLLIDFCLYMWNLLFRLLVESSFQILWDNCFVDLRLFILEIGMWPWMFFLIYCVKS